mgnify:CR=1 FL=1
MGSCSDESYNFDITSPLLYNIKANSDSTFYINTVKENFIFNLRFDSKGSDVFYHKEDTLWLDNPQKTRLIIKRYNDPKTLDYLEIQSISSNFFVIEKLDRSENPKYKVTIHNNDSIKTQTLILDLNSRTHSCSVTLDLNKYKK